MENGGTCLTVSETYLEAGVMAEQLHVCPAFAEDSGAVCHARFTASNNFNSRGLCHLWPPWVHLHIATPQIHNIKTNQPTKQTNQNTIFLDSQRDPQFPNMFTHF